MGIANGQVVGRFRIDALIGEGGMASVYRVSDTETGDRYALKVLATSSPTIAKRLQLEGQVQASFSHLNVVRVHEVILVEENPALVMELVDGPSLAQVLKHTPLTLPQANDIVTQILQGMKAVHEAGFVHRDLKPGNILLGMCNGKVTAKITDFGLVKALGASAEDRLTRTGSTMGTPAYMAPEQIRDASKVDARADVWSLGAVIQEISTGKRAFIAPDTLALLRVVCQAKAQPLPDDLPSQMIDTIRAALTLSRGKRPADAGALLEMWTHASADRAAHWPHDEHSEGLWALTSIRPHRAPEVPVPIFPTEDTGEDTPIVTTPRRPLTAVMLTTVIGLPTTMALIHQIDGNGLAHGGPFVAPLVVTGAVGAGALVHMNARRARNLRVPLWGWLLVPTVAFALGTIGTDMGTANASMAVSRASIVTRLLLCGMGASVALITSVIGSAIASVLLLLAASIVAGRSARSQPQDAVQVLLQVLAFGCVVVGTAAPSLLEIPAAPWSGLSILTAGGCLVAALIYGSRATRPKSVLPAAMLATAGWTAGVLTLNLLSAQAGWQELLRLAQEPRLGAVPVSLARSDLVAVLEVGLPSLMWVGVTSTGALLLAALRGRDRADVWPVACQLVVVLLTATGAWRGIQSTAEQLHRHAVSANAHWHLGSGFIDLDGSIVPESPVNHPFQDDDILVAIEQKTPRSAEGIGALLDGCTCGFGDGDCGLRERCLPCGITIPVTVKRGESLIALQAPIACGHPQPADPSLALAALQLPAVGRMPLSGPGAPTLGSDLDREIDDILRPAVTALNHLAPTTASLSALGTRTEEAGVSILITGRAAAGDTPQLNLLRYEQLDDGLKLTGTTFRRAESQAALNASIPSALYELLSSKPSTVRDVSASEVQEQAHEAIETCWPHASADLPHVTVSWTIQSSGESTDITVDSQGPIKDINILPCINRAVEHTLFAPGVVGRITLTHDDLHTASRW